MERQPDAVLEQRFEALFQEISRLRAALRPFANILHDMKHEAAEAESVGHQYPLEDDSRVEVEVKYLRQAAEALEKG